jgi:short-subunit dehydrogenase
MLKASHTFDLDPQDIQNMLIANHYPMTLLSKFAKNSFIQQYKKNQDAQKRYAMIQLSSMAGLRYILSVGVYSSTKTYNLQLHNMINSLNRAPGSFNTMTIDS